MGTGHIVRMTPHHAGGKRTCVCDMARTPALAQAQIGHSVRLRGVVRDARDSKTLRCVARRGGSVVRGVQWGGVAALGLQGAAGGTATPRCPA